MMRINRRAVISLLVAATVAVTVLPRPGLSARVIDVGQGDAILVQCGYRQMLVDGGPDRSVLAGLGRGMPAFDRDIDIVVLTHPHADHYLGLIAVMERYRVRRILTPDASADTPEYRAFLRAAGDEGLSPEPVAAGDSIVLGGCAVADVLWPSFAKASPSAPRASGDKPEGKPPSDPNEASVVLRVRRVDAASPRAAVLLTGDATADVEEELLRSGIALGADALKVGHHGSRFSSSVRFIEAVAPREAVISVGRNSYGHPAPAALLRLASRGIRVFRTDRDGDVVIRLGRERAAVRRAPFLWP